MRRKILIADDEEDILEMIEIRLSYAGFEVLRARDGEELVKRAMLEKPDLIISDVLMPKMNGYEAVKILRSKRETEGIPLIMLTARENNESELKEAGMGVDDCIVKPFRHEDLLAKIKMLIGEGTGKNGG